MAAAVAGAQNPSEEAVMASLEPKRRKTIRPKSDPLMPKGGVEPNDWMELANLEEGVRGVLVSVARVFRPLLRPSSSLALSPFFGRAGGGCVRPALLLVCQDDRFAVGGGSL